MRCIAQDAFLGPGGPFESKRSRRTCDPGRDKCGSVAKERASYVNVDRPFATLPSLLRASRVNEECRYHSNVARRSQKPREVRKSELGTGGKWRGTAPSAGCYTVSGLCINQAQFRGSSFLREQCPYMS
jgi:hypothetical protein